MVSVSSVLEYAEAAEVNFADCLISLLQSPALQASVALRQVVEKLDVIFTCLLEHPSTQSATLDIMQTAVKAKMRAAVRELCDKDNGWHFSAVHATPEKLKDFQMEEMSTRMREITPDLWDLVGFMLGSRQHVSAVHEDPDDDALWASQDVDVFLADDECKLAVGKARTKERQAQWRQELTDIKTTVVISTMMHANNQQCNALQSVVGVFLHSCGTPEKVIKTMARMGTSISVDAIDDAVKSLSVETTKAMEELGRTLLAAYAYDNFDVQLNVSTPTVDDGGTALVHLTSGDILQLDHGITTEDLRCSKQLWDSSPFNDNATQPSYPDFVDLQSTQHLRALHPETPDEMGHTRRTRFQAWQFLYDLVHHGPVYFHRYRDQIGYPEEVEQIPVTKLVHVPARAMDINESTVSGNLEAIQNLLHQGGVGDPHDDDDDGTQDYEYDVEDMSEYVVLIHGDLSTCERVQSVMDRRADEDTPWRRFQYVVFVLGLFHLKMAAADAIWRIFIASPAARKDLNSLMSFVTVIRSTETGKIGSKPKFRQMHEVIRHVGVGLRLDAWRVDVGRRDKKITSLEEFAATEPTLDRLREIAHTVCDNFVAGGEADIFLARLEHDAERDQQLENTMLLHEYFLLYEELTYAMNAGDIGRVETLFPAWIALFKATGKHKYAAQMTRFLTDVHFRYPEGLRKAVRYNMLVNPTGREHEFRGVDWVVELNNLFTKVSVTPHGFCTKFKHQHWLQDHNGGSGSNRSKDRIITESPLILVYRNCHANIEKNFKLAGLSYAHAAKDMTRSFQELTKYMKENRTNEFTGARKTEHEILDMMDEGLEAEFKVVFSRDNDTMDLAAAEDEFYMVDADDLSAEMPI